MEQFDYLVFVGVLHVDIVSKIKMKTENVGHKIVTKQNKKNCECKLLRGIGASNSAYIGGLDNWISVSSFRGVGAMLVSKSTLDVITCRIFSTSVPDVKLASVDDDGGLSGTTLVGFANMGARPFTGCIICCFSLDRPLCICDGIGGGGSFWFDIPLIC